MSEPVKLGKNPEDVDSSIEQTADAAEGQEDWNNDDELILMRRKKHKAHGENEGLNLTAMMDMFTIILVFLIKQYASAPENIPLSEVLQPPASVTSSEIQPAVTVIVSKTDITIDGEKVADVKNNQIVAPAGKDPTEAINGRLQKIVQRLELLEERSNGAAQFDGMIMLVVDEETTYELLNSILLVAGRNKFSTYKMIVKAASKK